MEELNQDIIHIDEQDEIIDIIKKIKQVRRRTVTLIIPKGAIILQDVTNLKILQKKAEELGKDISISKAGTDEMRQAPVRNASRIINEHPPRFQEKAYADIKPETKRISDMVRRGETVDLRKINLNKNEKIDRAENIYAGVSENHISVPEKPVENISEYKPEFHRKEATFDMPASIPKKENKREMDRENYFAKLSQDKKDNINLFEESLSSDIKRNSNENDARRIERTDLFDNQSRLKPDNKEGEKFDFSYGYDKKKKKKRTILPTISARFFAVFILICILTASLSLFFILPKASIAITLKKEDVKGDFNFILDKDTTEVDKDAGKIPAQTNDIVSEKTQSFTATGKKQLTTKAGGDLTILNECSTGEQLLVAGTRFLSKDTGKIFKIESNVVVPGFTKPEDSVVPGSLTVKVTADDAGETYNINATAFTIPKLQETGSWKYSCLYARSDKPMTGGSNKEVTIISQADLDKAKDTLAALAQADNTVKSEQKNDELIYINDKNQTGTVTANSSAKVNDVADKFDMTVSIKKSVQTIKKSDLETLLNEKIVAVNNYSNAKAVDNSLVYQIGDTAEKDKQISISISATQSFIFELDQDKIKKEIAGKDKQDLNDYFTNLNGIKSVSVKFWPFWVNKVPNSFDKINITLDISNSA
jgi:hypothetical protein